MRSFYLTTPIYYVNDLPHIGHIYTTVVADVLARYRRMSGDAVYFLTGTDEHGQKIERAAAKEGIAPIELADRVVERYHQLWRQLGISNDGFIRTTEERHAAGVDALIARLTASGDLYTARHEGWYCTGCEVFYTDKELTQPGNRCPIHETAAEWRAEDNVFFRLSRYQDRLLAWYDAQPDSVRPASRRNEVRTFVESGLRDLSLSRANLAWGIPFPGHPGQTVYVWFDALANYITALGFGQASAPLYDRFWAQGDTRLHLVGKDILRFHAVFWPAFLMAAGLPLPTTVWAHGWWLRDEKKMSKSVGNVVRPDHLVERFGVDSLRYFLLRDMVFGQDASFSDEAFVDRFNSDLANDLGNTASRLVTLSRNAFGGKTPPVPCDNNPVLEAARRAVAEYGAAMDELAFSRALEALWRLLAEANQYIVAREPWKLIKSEGPSDGLSRVLWNGLEAVRIVATGLLPFMPETAPRVLRAIGVQEIPSTLGALTWGGLPNGAELPELQPLFPRIDRAAYLAEVAPTPSTSTARPAGSESKPMISIDQFTQIELRVATVLTAEAVAKSEKLVKMTVDLAEETGPRQIVAGIAKAYPPETLVGRQVIIVANLQPAKLMGVESNGMVLAASIEGVPVLLHPEQAVPNGTRVK
ncbi:MAG: methionine--tRNA ligase [Acidobacteriota bacterium]